MERPDWTPGDMLHSMVDIAAPILGAAKVMVAEALGKIDAWLADYGDE